MSRQSWVVRGLLAGALACVLVVSGIFYVSGKQVTENIEREVKLLLAMGVDVRPVAKAEDAQRDYKLIADAIKANAKSPQPLEITLQMLEEAAKKPAVGFDETRLSSAKKRSPRDDSFFIITRWAAEQESKAARKHDWKTLDRFFEVEMRMRTQYLAGEHDMLGTMSLAGGPPPLYVLMRDDARVRQWLRKKYENLDIKPMLAAKLSGIGRRARRFNGNLGIGETQPKPMLRQMAEDQASFQGAADLSVLREYRKIVEATLKLTPEAALASETVTQLRMALTRRPSAPANWAGRKVIGWTGACALLRQRNAMLIELDLRELHENKKPLVPTWSRSHLVDPFTGNAVEVKAAKDIVELSSVTDNPLNKWSASFSF